MPVVTGKSSESAGPCKQVKQFFLIFLPYFSGQRFYFIAIPGNDIPGNDIPGMTFS